MSSGDTILLSPSLAGDTIYLTSTPIVINKNITLIADPNLNIYVKGQNVPRVFEVVAGVSATISGLRVICGTSTSAACLQNNGTVTLHDAILYDNNGEPGIETQVVNTGVLIIDGGVEVKWE
jgi:hypothetical protein